MAREEFPHASEAMNLTDRQSFARRLRREAPFTEKLLWHRLRAGQITGLKFRRQQPIGPYVVDFFCASHRLVVEIDGTSHDERETYDRERQTYLEGEGLRVVRFTNGQVLVNVESVVANIAAHCGVEV